MAEYTKAQLTDMIIGKLQRNFGRTVEEATKNHMFKACALVLRDIMSRRQMETDNRVWEGQQRQVHLTEAADEKVPYFAQHMAGLLSWGEEK